MNATPQKSGLEDVVRNFWATRPQRPRADRKVAGVAVAIANRYAIDPTLVRVAFVVATLFGGSGILFYLLGWLLLPQQDDEVSAFEGMLHRGRSSISPMFTVVLCIALIPTTSWTLGGGFLIGGATSGIIGAAPFAWDLPEPKPVTPQRESRPRRPRSKVGLIGLAVGLVTFAVCMALQPVASGWLTPGHIVGSVLAAVALTMIGGAFAGGGRGLIPLAVLLSVGGLVSMNASGHPDFGDAVTAPTSIAAVQSQYDGNAGDYTLDLTKLPNSGAVTTTVRHDLGDVHVILPPRADVTVTCESRLGDNRCLTQEQSGASSTLHTVDNGIDGPGGLKIDLTVHNRVGDLEVSRG